jgi:hypothetical protein
VAAFDYNPMAFPFSFRLQATTPTCGLDFPRQAKAILLPMRAAIGMEGPVHTTIADSRATLRWQQSVIDQLLRMRSDPYGMVSGATVTLTAASDGLHFLAIVHCRFHAALALLALGGGIVLGLLGDWFGWVIVASAVIALPISFALVRKRVSPWLLSFLLASVEEASADSSPAAT